MKIYVPARNLYIANEFCNRHNFEGLEIKITTGISSLFVYINDIINNENEPVLIMHDDTYFNKDFISRVNNAITLLNKINSNWGIAGNAGISCYELGFSSQNMVRYIMDPHGGPNLRGKILPAESIDGNTILLNTPKLRENKIRLPNFNGFHLYDIILSIETIKSGLGVYIIPQLLCYHASSGNQIEFNKAFYNDAFIKYLQKKLINNHLKTINGSLPLPFSHLSEYNRIDIKNKSIENCLNTSKDASVAIVIRTRFTRINLLQRTVVTIKSFISNIKCKNIFKCYIITDATYVGEDFQGVSVLKTDKIYNDSRVYLIFKASNLLKEKYIWFIDDDDWLFPNEADYLTKCILSAPENSTFFIGCQRFNERFNSDEINSFCTTEKYFSPRNFFKSLSGYNQIPFSGMISQRERIKMFFNNNIKSLNYVTYLEDFMLELFNFIDHDFFPICIDKKIVGISIRDRGNTVTELDRTNWNKSFSSVMYNIIINNGSNIFSYIYNNIFYDELLKKNKDITNKIECLRQSYSFRFGRFITYIPRKIRDAIKYFKQYCFK